MSDININPMLAQMRAMSGIASTPSATVATPVQETDFGALLKRSIDSVNNLQQGAGKLTEAFETGAPNVSLAEVMVASQKAGVSFQAMLQVRNKLIDAYQDVMNMPM